MDIKKRIEELREDVNVDSVKVLRAHLTIEGFSDKAITSAIKEAGLRTARKGFIGVFMDYLVESNPTKEEVEAYIDGKGEYFQTSNNVKAHKGLYLGYYILAKRVRDSLEAEVEVEVEDYFPEIPDA